MDYGTQFDAHQVAYVRDLIEWADRFIAAIKTGEPDTGENPGDSTGLYPAWLDDAV